MRYAVLRPTRCVFLHRVLEFVDDRILRHRFYSVCGWLSQDSWVWIHDHWEEGSL